jgi:MFS family permease
MIASFGVEKNDVAKWAGFTGAIFSVAQSCTAVAWGRASDKFGRKPIILSGLASTMVCFLIWGMSTSLPMAITVRAIMGGGNGNGMSTSDPPYSSRPPTNTQQLVLLEPW